VTSAAAEKCEREDFVWVFVLWFIFKVYLPWAIMLL